MECGFLDRRVYGIIGGIDLRRAVLGMGFGTASSATRLVFLPMWLALFFFVRDVVLLVRGS